VEALVITLEEDKDPDVRRAAAYSIRCLLPKIPAGLSDWVNVALSRFECEPQIYYQEPHLHERRLHDDDAEC
jgi:hypothetical protein